MLQFEVFFLTGQTPRQIFAIFAFDPSGPHFWLNFTLIDLNIDELS